MTLHNLLASGLALFILVIIMVFAVSAGDIVADERKDRTSRLDEWND